jgi:hypothetical protein
MVRTLERPVLLRTLVRTLASTPTNSRPVAWFAVRTRCEPADYPHALWLWVKPWLIVAVGGRCWSGHPTVSQALRAILLQSQRPVSAVTECCNKMPQQGHKPCRCGGSANVTALGSCNTAPSTVDVGNSRFLCLLSCLPPACLLPRWCRLLGRPEQAPGVSTPKRDGFHWKPTFDFWKPSGPEAQYLLAFNVSSVVTTLVTRYVLTGVANRFRTGSAALALLVSRNGIQAWYPKPWIPALDTNLDTSISVG